MINAAKLLADLKRLRKVLDADLRVTHAAGAQRDAVQAEWREAFDLGRTRDTFEAFLDGAFDQAVVHWVLGCVFLRFLEDNLLVDRPFLSGPGERLDLAKERQQAHFRARPHDSDTEYLIATFSEAARLPGIAGLFDPAHNPLFRLPISGDGAMTLIRFFREVLPETGELAHDFADPGWGTRFLGDLYQDLSEEARKRYALLQTPEFVEAWILDRTLEPAIREFGHERVTMIDPACGSGHFLLGGFDRLLREWQRFAPGLPPPEQAQRALDAIAGVDLNPFAVEIARFRLLVAALRAAGVQRLSSAPGFRLQLAAGDSLLHGRHFFRRELGGTEEGFRRVLRHHFAAEDTAAIDYILGRQYHAVVGNPPYITPKDPAMRDAYREIYVSCHMKYGLGVPFTERFFDLAQPEMGGQAAGFVGLIVANSFMKREFGSKLIEGVLPNLDLTHVVDCSGAYIPGHGTPTVILFGRNRAPVAAVVRTVRGIRGEPSSPEDPARGLVWSATVTQIDLANSTSEFISTEDTLRNALARHPWNMGGGGAGEVQEQIEEAAFARLEQKVAVRAYKVWIGSRAVRRESREIGVFGMTNADEVMLADDDAFARAGCEPSAIRPLIVGDVVRDWRITAAESVIFPYAAEQLVSLSHLPQVERWLWPARTTMGNRATFAQRTYFAEGRPWWEWHQVALERLKGPTITFPFVATHNHFVLERGGNVFSRTAPVIKLPKGASENEHLGLVALLNSSTACFWMKQVSQNRGSTVDDRGARQRTLPFEDFYEFTAGILLTHRSAIKATNGLYLGAWFGIMSHEARRAQL
ncbi:Type I restriction-modification system, DNA methylase subunit [Rhizobiales bacterium GAS113]|nr:Type I restriction-modification system, DNA methylase subunit [Rhizobiales bacterium GAS113]